MCTCIERTAATNLCTSVYFHSTSLESSSLIIIIILIISSIRDELWHPQAVLLFIDRRFTKKEIDAQSVCNRSCCCKINRKKSAVLKFFTPNHTFGFEYWYSFYYFLMLFKLLQYCRCHMHFTSVIDQTLHPVPALSVNLIVSIFCLTPNLKAHKKPNTKRKRTTRVLIIDLID